MTSMRVRSNGRIGMSTASAACLRGGVVQAAVFDLSSVVLP